MNMLFPNAPDRVVLLCALTISMTLCCASCTVVPAASAAAVTKHATQSLVTLGFIDETQQKPKHVVVIVDPTAIHDPTFVADQVATAARALGTLQLSCFFASLIL